MRVLVCGGRDFGIPDIHNPDDAAFENSVKRAKADKDRLKAKMLELRGRGMSLLIHGGARGADNWAGQWAEFNGVPVNVYWADWRRWGPAAGPIRNKLMLEDGQPDLVVAFPGGRGTEHMIGIAHAAGVPVELAA